jgi:hypothetical protein
MLLSAVRYFSVLLASSAQGSVGGDIRDVASQWSDLLSRTMFSSRKRKVADMFFAFVDLVIIILSVTINLFLLYKLMVIKNR